VNNIEYGNRLIRLGKLMKNEKTKLKDLVHASLDCGLIYTYELTPQPHVSVELDLNGPDVPPPHLEEITSKIRDIPVKSLVPVIDQVRIAAATFERTTGKKPVSVYLGYSEWADLKSSDWARQQYVETREPTADGKRIYVVTQNSHLVVA